VTLDELRAALPEHGLALYAFDPLGLVTLEVHDARDGSVRTFAGVTAADAVAAAAAALIPPAPDVFD
jgi:hypothetical protein